MKFIKVLIYLLISANSYGQFYTNINTSIYWKQPSGFDKVFIGNDTFQITDNSKRWIAIKNAVMYFHDGTKWTAISGGGGGGGSYTLPTASPTVLGGIKYSTDFYLNTLAQLAIDTSKRNLWNQVALLPFYAKIDSVRKWLNDTANAHDYVFGSDFTVTGRNVSVNFPAQLTDTYGSSIWPGLTDKPTYWDAKTDYSEFLDSINSLRAIRRDSIFFNRADFLGSGTSLSPISLASNTDVSSTETGLIKPGYVTWSGTGYTYDVTPAIYRVNGLYYTSVAGSVTLDAADGALNRIDAVVVDTFGVVSKITGVAASNPVAPIPNPSSQVLLTNITVTPGSSAPSTLNTIVYNEEGNGEYTGSSSGVTSNTANTTFPFSGAKSDNIGAWTSGSTVTFTNGTTASATSYTYFKFFIRLKGVVQNATSISVIFYNGTTPVSKLVSIVNYGINKSLVGSYQNVSVPFSVFGFTSNQFNKIQFRFGGPDGPGCYLDFIQLQNSAVTETGSNTLTDVFLKSDSLFKTVGGNSLFVGKVGGSGGAATDTTSLSSRINAKLNISDAATTYFPLAGGTLTGTGGNGYVGFNPQSSTPSTPTSGFRLFATNPGAFAWITSQGYARELRVRAQTQNNIYYLQDKSYTLADSAEVAGKLNISDTANMLNGYARKVNTITVNGSTQNLGNNPSFTVSGGTATDTTSLSSRINLKADKTNTVTINGNSQQLGSNPSFTVSGGSSSSSTAPVWNRRGVVMSPLYSTDQNNAFEPNVILDSTTTPVILTGHTKVFRMWFTTGWTSMNINYAESLDGINWTRYSGNPVVASHRCSFVLKSGSTFVMYTATPTGTQIDRYTSTNGATWTLANAGVVVPPGSWANKFFNTSVIIDGGTWRMLVDGGATTGTNYSQGYYTSPDGITWTAYAGNPVLTGVNQGATFLKKIGSTYYVWCGVSESSINNLPSDMTRYQSTDMINWTRSFAGYSMPRRTEDEGPFTAVGQLTDAYLTAVDTSVYLYHSASQDGSQQAGKLQIKLAIAPMSFASLVQTNEGDGGIVPIPTGKETYINYGIGGGIGGDSSLKYKLSGVNVSSLNEAGLVVTPYVAATVAGDTLSTMYVNSAGMTANGQSSVKMFDLKINKNFLRFDNLYNYSIGSGGAAQPTTSNVGTFFVGNGAGNTATSAYNSTFIGGSAGGGATSANNSNFFGGSAGFNATGANNSNFFGNNAGINATSATNSNFFGNGAGQVTATSSASSSNFFGNSAGKNATGASNSNFFGSSAGQGATSAQQSNFFGNSAGINATGALLSNFFGSSAGSGATGASYSNFIGFNNGNSTTFAITGSNNILLGTNITTPAAATSNTLNIGNVLYGTNLNSTTTGNPTNTPKPLGQIGIGVATPAAGALLDLTSTTMGVLFPRMTTAQRTAITLVAANDGLIVYDTDFHKLFLNENGTWVQK